uniref:MBL fold metallo-hydrolase n=1 Tax=candidate division WOR-3 bacterium TaxID=2052148 RepID=A0A7C4UDN3_UNCW3
MVYMEIKNFITGSLSTNTYIIEGKGGSIIIDPGSFVEVEKTPKFIINTHGHFDHIKGNRVYKEKFGANICIHLYDNDFLTSPVYNGSILFDENVVSPPGDIFLKDGDSFIFEDEEFRILHTPGHTPGSICILYKEFIFTGDTIMMFGIGRTDFYGGSEELIKKSIERILKIEENLIVLPGHGPKGRLNDLKKALL